MAVRDMTAPSQTQIKKDDNLAGAAMSLMFNKNKATKPNTTVTGLENWDVRKNAVKVPVNNNANPTHQAAAAMIKNNPVTGNNGETGVRKALVDMGYDNAKIGYNNTTGNVTYDAYDVIKPGRIENGTSYAAEGDVLAAAQVIANNGGQAPVKVVDYMNGAAPNVPVEWNHKTGQLNIGGAPVNAATFGGRAYMTKDAVDAAAQQYYKNTGIQSDIALAQKYAQQNNDTADMYRQLAAEKFNYNPETDPSTLALQKMYSNMAQKAVRDVAGQYGSMNGGLLTSGGLEAIASARAEYDNQFLSQIPTLQQNAYNQFVSEQQRQQGLYGAVNDLNNQNYQMEYGANRNTVADGQASAERQRVQRYEDVQYAFNNARARGYFTPEEALIVGVPEGTSPYAADITSLEMQNRANLEYYKQQLDAQNEAELALLGAQIANGYKRISGGSGGGGIKTPNDDSAALKNYSKNVDSFVDVFNENYRNSGTANNGGSSRSAYESSKSGNTGDTKSFITMDASGNYKVDKNYAIDVRDAVKNTRILNDAEKAAFLKELGI